MLTIYGFMEGEHYGFVSEPDDNIIQFSSKSKTLKVIPRDEYWDFPSSRIVYDEGKKEKDKKVDKEFEKFKAMSDIEKLEYIANIGKP